MNQRAFQCFLHCCIFHAAWAAAYHPGRNSKNEFRHFLSITLGSSYELETQIIVSNKLNYVREEIANDLLQEIMEEQMMISGYMKKLKEDS